LHSKTPPPWEQSKQRIFISYRRDDTQWAAGRLSDSLSAYFGDERVFRDIDGIAGGADFGHVIEQTLGDADAVVVLIGNSWLSAKDDKGNRRLDDPRDWVVQEVAAALDKGVPVYPVLIDEAPMPRSEELPAVLKPLTRFNAISLSDSRWMADVSRLAKIVALDIPSQTERQLHLLNLLVSVLLMLSVLFTLSVTYSNLLTNSSTLTAEGEKASGDSEREWSLSQLFVGIGHDDAALTSDPSKKIGDCRAPPLAWFNPLSKAQSGLIFLVAVPASALLFVFARHVDPGRRRYFHAAAGVGAIGSFAAFSLFYFVCNQYETVVISYIGMLVAPLMLVLLGLSGFKAK